MNIDYSCLKTHFDRLHSGEITDVIALQKEGYDMVARDISDIVYRYINYMNRSLVKKELLLQMKEKDIQVLYTDTSHIESNPINGIISIILSDNGHSCWFRLHSPDGERLMPFASLSPYRFSPGRSEIIPGFYSPNIYIVQVINKREIKLLQNNIGTYLRKYKDNVYDMKGFYNIIYSAFEVMIKIISKDKYYHDLSSLLSSGISIIPFYYGMLHYFDMASKYSNYDYFTPDDITDLVDIIPVFAAGDNHVWINLLDPYEVLCNLLKESYDIRIGATPIKTDPDIILLTILGFTTHDELYQDAEQLETVKVEVNLKEGEDEDATRTQI